MRSEIDEYNKTHNIKNTKKSFLQCIRVSLCKLVFKQINLGSEKWLKYQHKISLLSSTNNDAEIRSLFYEITMKENCKGSFYCLPHTILNFPERIHLGYNVFINRNVNIVARETIFIGDNVLIGPNVVINSGTHIFSDKTRPIREQGHKCEKIIISNNVFIGGNVFILPGVTIGEGAVIGAGAVVTKSIPPFSVAVGIPARVIHTI